MRISISLSGRKVRDMRTHIKIRTESVWQVIPGRWWTQGGGPVSGRAAQKIYLGVRWRGHHTGS